MGSPPPPPAHHGYGHASPRDLHSPFSDNSGRYSDEYGRYSDIHYTDRPGSRAPSSRTASSTSSTSNKSYLYFQFKRGEEGWSGARRYEINASQDEIKKKAKSRSKSGNALDQLNKMGRSRLDQIDNLRQEIDGSELDGSLWEPIFIETTKSKQKGNVLEVSEFSIIFQRRTKRPESAQRRPSKLGDRPEIGSRRQSKASERPVFQEVRPQQPVFTPQPRPIIADTSKGAKALSKDEYLQTPFADVPLFSPHGQPLSANGPMPFAAQPMAANIPRDRPIAQMLPKIQTQPAATTGRKSHARVTPGDPLDLDALLGDTHAGDPDGIIEVGDDHPLHGGRSAAGPRRHSSAQRSSHGHRYSNVNVETRHPDFYRSNRSSWATDDGSVIYGELDELSSRTSDESRASHRSPARKTYRTLQHARHGSNGHSPASPRYRGGETFVLPERSRRPTPVDTQRPYFGAVEQVSPRQNANKPLIHQQTLPRTSSHNQQIPPVAEYPSYYVEQDKKEHRVHDYIREGQQEQARRAREEEVAQREREVERKRREYDEQIKRSTTSKPVEVTTGVRKRYTYEPRDIYGGH